MIQDLRFGIRMLLKHKGYTVIAILTLALGIGANTAIFTLFDKVLIRALPVEQPHQLVNFARDATGAPASFSYPMYSELRARSEAMLDLAAYVQQPFSLSDNNHNERVTGQIVSGNYFAVLGVRPVVGRMFLPEEDRTPGTHPVAVISHGLWQRRFGADSAAIGKTVSLNGYRYTIVGVTPSEFTGTTRGTVNDVYVPAMMQVQAQPGRNSKLEDRGSGWLYLLGRLRPEANRAQAEASVSAVTEEAKQAFPGSTDPARVSLTDGSRGFTVRVNDLTLPLKLLMGVVAFVLVVACANVANLLLARGTARRKEIAIRLAIGASRTRIVRQLLTESLILTVLGAGAGLLVADALTSLLLGFQEQTTFVPRSFDGSLDVRVLGFTFGLSLLTGIVFGLAPALQAARSDFVSGLKEDTPLSAGMRRLSTRNLLVVVQVALSLVVLIGAGLCVQSLRRLQAIDPGIEPAKVLTASFDLSLSGYKEARGQQFFGQLSDRIAALPGVEAVSLARGVAFSTFVWIRSATVEGYQAQPDENLAFNFNVISPGYFQTLGTPLVRGRDFTSQDGASAPRIVIVNEATARRYWPGEDAIGKRIKYGNIDKFAEVVGLAKDTRDRGGLTADPRPAIYAPLLQQYAPDMTLHVRTTTEAPALFAALRGEVQALDTQLPVYNLKTLAEQKDGSLYSERMAATLLTLFGLLALLLATIGLYGVLSYTVTQRTHELDIRLALGAQPRDVLRLVIGHGLSMTFAGLVLGLTTAFALTRLLKKFLFDVSTTDPFTFAVIVLLLAVVALVACWAPARRAARVDPLVALRCE